MTASAEGARGRAKFSTDQDQTSYELTFAGFLAVRLMEFDYNGKHFSYHGRKLENAVKRLTIAGGPQKATAAELTVWGQATYDWKRLTTGAHSE